MKKQTEAHRAELAGATFGKGCTRFSKPEKMDLALIETLLLEKRDAE